MPTTTRTQQSGVMHAIRATDLIRQDHRRIRELFREFESAESNERPSIGLAALRELDAHTAIEEEYLYPVARRELGVDALVTESEEAHHILKLVMLELKAQAYGPRWDAKFALLADNVLEHMRREEGDLLPRIERSSLDLQELGARMASRRVQLLRHPMLSKGRAAIAAPTLLVLGVAAGLIMMFWDKIVDRG